MAFDPKATTHTHRNSLFPGEASKAAYHPETIADWLEQSGFGDAKATVFDVAFLSC
jgi:hypothetical protein